MRDDRQRLLDVLDAIERINKYAVKGKANFNRNELVQTWVIHHLQIIGEACRAVSDPLRSRYPEVPWQKIVGMRNILVHIYFGIDQEVVWSVVEKDLPPLKENIEVTIQQWRRFSSFPHAFSGNPEFRPQMDAR